MSCKSEMYYPCSDCVKFIVHNTGVVYNIIVFTHLNGFNLVNTLAHQFVNRASVLLAVQYCLASYFYVERFIVDTSIYMSVYVLIL